MVQTYEQRGVCRPHSPTTVADTASRPGNPMMVVNAACRADDVSLMEQAISMAAQPDSRAAVRDVVQRGLMRSAAHGAVHVLLYVLDRGADVRTLSTSSILAHDEEVEPSQDALEILVAHGWDINNLGPRFDDWPLLWHVTRYPDLLTWCLDHGAIVDVPDNSLRDNGDGTQTRVGRRRPTILGLVAASGSVETFEMLRARGAPLDPRTLHLAVEQATYAAPRDGKDVHPSYTRRMDMIRHLVDVLKLDVNAVVGVPGDPCSTPLCYAASRPTRQDFRQLVHFLLDRGADINLGGGVELPSPVALAQSMGNKRFLEAVEEWQWQTYNFGDGPDLSFSPTVNLGVTRTSPS